MNYFNHYNKLCVSRQQLNRIKLNDGQLESHHIVPKCLNGTNNKENLVLLTPREHYIAHWLLTKIYTGKIKAKMCYAFFKMCQRNKNQKRTVTSTMFHRAKIAMHQYCVKENASYYGKKHSHESKQKLRDKRLGSKNPMFGKKAWNAGLTKNTSNILKESGNKFKLQYKKENNPRFGKKRSLEIRLKLSKGMKGISKSEEHKRKLSIANKGKYLSNETKIKIGAAHKGKTHHKITCPYCTKTGGYCAMYRWHFNNCKHFPIS